jgi:putative peptide zinc metalloprotease protein
LGNRYPLGMSPNLPNCPSGSGGLIRIYGVAAFMWRMLICVGLIVAASTMFAGAGVVLSALAVLLWFCRPLLQFAGFLAGRQFGERPNLRRFWLVVGCTMAVTVFVLGVVPRPGVASAPGLVAYEPLSIIRADSSGFLRRILVTDGQVVEAGEPLVVLVNDELEMELADMGLQIEESRLRARQFERNQELGALQAKQSRIRSLEDRHAELLEQVDQLTLVAPMFGRVVAPSLDDALGTFLREGDEVLSIGDAMSKELKVSIAQQDVQRFQTRIGANVHVWLPGSESLACRLQRISPRASAQPPDPALCANQGGPLPIEVDDRSDNQTEQQFRFLRPRFTGYVTLTPDQSRRLYAGQLAIISFAPLDESMGR